MNVHLDERVERNKGLQLKSLSIWTCNGVYPQLGSVADDYPHLSGFAAGK